MFAGKRDVSKLLQNNDSKFHPKNIKVSKLFLKYIIPIIITVQAKHTFTIFYVLKQVFNKWNTLKKYLSLLGLINNF